MERATRRLSPATRLLSGSLRLALALAVLALLPARARADEGTGWDDARRSRLEDRVAALEAAARGEPPARRTGPEDPSAPATVDLKHGDVRFVGDLARVDVTLEITNRTQAPLEWSRTFVLDPRAEVVGASLERRGTEPVDCRTLPLEDARRIYGEARGPRNPTGRNRDPLRLEREREDRLTVVVWPVGVGETLRAHVTFVTPLLGEGRLRTYVEPLGGAVREPERPTTAPGSPRPDTLVTTPLESEVLVRPGTLVYASASPEMVLAGSAAGTLRFVDATGTAEPATVGRDPSRLVFESPRSADEAIAVKGAGLGARCALWRVDPVALLAAHGVEPRAGLTVRLLPEPGSTSRIAPDRMEVLEGSAPVTARLGAEATSVRYGVEVREGELRVASFVDELPVRRVALEERLEDAVTGWHRASLARRALRWAGDDPARRLRAIGYAVDAGVLLPGTAALAVPPAERALLPRASRRQYARDGAELGAPGGEADWTSPPGGVR